jgi:hypothetical protein
MSFNEETYNVLKKIEFFSNHETLNTKRGIEIGNSDKFESYLKNIFLTNIF